MPGAGAAGAPARRVPDPYRVLFAIGVALGLAGGVVWPIYALFGIAYPGPLHRVLMIEGFQTSFVLGFLLTAMTGFLRNPKRCGGLELGVVAAANLACGAFAIGGWETAAHVMFLVSVAALAIVLLRRYRGRSADPPEEFRFVAFGLVLALAAGVVLVGGARAMWFEPSPGFGLRLVSLGFVLSLVLGLGGLLVPVFAGVPHGLEIHGVAGPHERPGRRSLYSAVIAVLAGAVAVDGLGWPAAAAWMRAIAATPMLLVVWKVAAPGGHRTISAGTLRAAGVLILAGLWLAAIVPARPLAGFHLTFIGGYGLLTLAIGSRVVVAHGGHPIALEARILNPFVVGAVGLAALTRVGAEFGGAGRDAMLAASGTLWVLGWLVWAWRALPRMLRLAAGR